MSVSLAALFTVMIVGGCSSLQPSKENPVIPGTDLQITVTGGGKPDQTLTLSCDPIGGTLPDSKAICGRLVAPQKNPFPDARSQIGCEPAEGDGTLHVVGTWKNNKIDQRFDQTTSCAIERWRTTAKLLGVTRPLVTPTPG